MAADLRDERRSRRLADPDPTAIVAIATDPGARLWERTPRDDDFLRLRVGLARQPSDLVIVEPDNQRRRPELAAVPVAVDLRRAGVVGLAAPDAVRGPLARAMVAAAATLHGPRDLRLVVLAAEPDADDVGVGGLVAPHRAGAAAGSPRPTTRDRLRALATSRVQVADRLAELVALIAARSAAAQRRWREPAVDGPRVLVVIDGARALRDERGPGVGPARRASGRRARAVHRPRADRPARGVPLDDLRLRGRAVGDRGPRRRRAGTTTCSPTASTSERARDVALALAHAAIRPATAATPCPTGSASPSCSAGTAAP